MSFQEELYYKIEAYLSGELDAGEVTAFENQIAADDFLKAEVEKHKVANALIIEQRLVSVKNILQEERIKDSTNSGKPNNPFGFILLAVAAIGIGGSVFMLNKGEDIVSSKKEENQNNQTVSTTIAPDNKNVSGNKERASKDASQPVVADADNGFHKQQIQQMEEHLRVDEKGSLYIDTAAHSKKSESLTSALPITKKASEQIQATTDPCAHVTIQSTVKASASCSHEATGTILVSSIQGGTKPYTVTIIDSHKESVLNDVLHAGTYQVYITDANACEKIYSNVQVIEKECSIDYSFNPFIGEKWLIESYKTGGQLEIYNKGGVLYYKENLEANASNEWTGIGYNNQILPGYYIFVIKYADGTIKKGSVTIVQ